MVSDGFQKLIEQKKKGGYDRTAANYRSVVHKLRGYLPYAAESLTVPDIDREWTDGFAGWLRTQHPKKPQTADFYFRTLRAMYNGTCGLLKINLAGGTDPFSGITFSGKQPSKRALAKEEVEKLLVPEFRESLDEHLRESLDILVFILFMRGMVFQDVYNLTWDMIDDDDHIHYLRSKTKAPIYTKMPTEVRSLMERYRKADFPFVFPFLHESKNKKKEGGTGIPEQSALHRVNRHAHEIGWKAGLSIPLSTYVIRHTWATLMLEAAKPVELISQCLGHTSIRTTQIYLSRISVSRVDKEVDDMFNQMLRPQTKTGEKESNKGKVKKERKNPPLRKSKGNPKKIPEDEKQDIAVTPKKCPFLRKKETLYQMVLPFTFLRKKETFPSKTLHLSTFLAAKIHIVENITNFLSYFSPNFYLSILFFVQ